MHKRENSWLFILSKWPSMVNHDVLRLKISIIFAVTLVLAWPNQMIMFTLFNIVIEFNTENGSLELIMGTEGAAERHDQLDKFWVTDKNSRQIERDKENERNSEMTVRSYTVQWKSRKIDEMRINSMPRAQSEQRYHCEFMRTCKI